MTTPLYINALLEDLTVLMEPFAYYNVSEHDDRLFVYSDDIITSQALACLHNFAHQHHVKCSGVEAHGNGVRYFMYL